jgi:hypothetical protein
MLFPVEGRMIAVGVLSLVAGNLMDPTIGHVATKRDGIPVYFRDYAGFGDMKEKEVDTRAVSSLLVAASKLCRTLKGDPVLTERAEWKAVFPQISQLVQVAALVIGKQAQNPDGSIRSKMGSADVSGNLGSQIGAIRVYLAALNSSETPEKMYFVMARLVPALQYLFKYQITTPKGLSLEARLNLLAVWNQSQSALRGTRLDLPWAEWEDQIRSVSEL